MHLILETPPKRRGFYFCFLRFALEEGDSMKKVAVFGKPGSGKSTLSKQLAEATGIELHALDSILYQQNGKEVDRECYEDTHNHILTTDTWIIEGFGPLNSQESFNKRLEAADTLIYIDLPYPITYWFVTKRFLKGLFQKPEGWPEGVSVVKGTLESYKVLKLCPMFWNDRFMQRIEKASVNKSLYVIRSIAELNRFVGGHVQ